MSIIFFKWFDAAMFGNEQVGLDYIKESSLIEGYVSGFLVEERKDSYVVALDYFPEHTQYRGVHIYPKSGVDKKSVIIKEVISEYKDDQSG